ncbi:unnamed protein product [Brachionus calyciflorus]|uniref:Transmembrane protein 106 N-terminal domain-containing protein n=1 Tax=Brachionus calyciflorus TaxID=104777 RepID=A0A813M3A4_9BILA|nr:unnamed protein product [Brachionus calyciflorus]
MVESNLNLESNETTSLLGGEKECPTCKGCGKIYQEEQNKLVALIPVSDNRLKPKRIWLWILSTFSLCLFVVFLLMFWLSPRSIEIINDASDVHPYNFTFIKDNNVTIIGMILHFDETFHIKNNNYFSIEMKNISLQLNRNSHYTMPKICYPKDFLIPARTSVDFTVKVKYIMYSVNDPYAGLCITGILNNLFSFISTSFSFSTLWNRNLLLESNKIQYIYCSNKTLNH